MRATDAVGDRDEGHPGAPADGARGGGPRARRRQARARRADRDRLRQGQQRRRRARGGPPAAPGRARGRRAGRLAARVDGRGRAGAGQDPARPGAGAVPPRPARRRRTRSSTRCSARASRARRATPPTRSILAINSARARVIAADVPSGVNASTGEVEGSAVRALATATFHQAKPGLWISPGKEHAGIVEVVDIGIPDGRARGGRDRADRRRRAVRDAPPHLGLDEVLLRQRVHHRRLARADGRAVDGGAGGDARRRGLRDGRRAPIARAVVHGAAAGGDDGRAARARRRADPDRAAARARGDRPRRRRRARPGPQQGARARRSSRASSSSASTSRS